MLIGTRLFKFNYDLRSCSLVIIGARKFLWCMRESKASRIAYKRELADLIFAGKGPVRSGVRLQENLE